MMMKAILIDDEHFCIQVLTTLLEKHCPEISIQASCSSAAEGLRAIREQQPDIVFLDIEMPKMNGFEMLSQLDIVNFDLIFTTSYDQYAMKAIRFSAMDYLLKPIDREELQNAVRKSLTRSRAPSAAQIEVLFQKMKSVPAAILKVALPTMEGLLMVAVENIICCESDSNYSIVLLKDRQRIVVSRTLKEMEEMLTDHAFARVHHSHLVNLNEIIKYIKGEGGYLVMSNGASIDVSRTRKEALLKKLLQR